MRKFFLAALAAAVLFCPSPARAVTYYSQMAGGPVIGNITATTVCPGGVTATVAGSGTVEITVAGTFVETLAVQASGDQTNYSGDLTVYPRAGGAGVVTMTAPGIWTMPVLADLSICVYGKAFTSGTAAVGISFSPGAGRVFVTNDAANPLFISGSFSSSGTADVVSAGAPTTFNGNAVCTGSLLTAGEQSAGFHLDSGTLAATLTPQCSSATSGATSFTNGQFSDRLGAKTDTLVVTNPNAQVDFTIVCPGVVRRVQVCTTAFTSGSATGLANATFFQAAAAAGGGGGGVVTQGTGTNLHTVTDATSTTAATQSGTWTMQPGNTANTTPWLFKIDQTTPGTTNGVVINNTASVQGLGAVGAGSGGWQNVQGDPAMTPLQVANKVTAPLFANAADNFAVAATLNAACTTTTACSAASSIQWAVNGAQSGEATITAISSPVGITVACDKSYDGGTTYLLAVCDLWQKGVYKTGSLANGDLAASTQWAVYFTGAPSHIRIRISVYTSGSFTVAGRSVFAPSWPFPVEAKTTTQNAVTLTASTAETTLLAAGGAGVFLDLTEIACTNSSTSSSLITVRDATAGSLRIPISCPAAVGPCEGFVFARVPWRQTTANNNWTIQSSASASSYICTAQAVPR